MFFVFVFLTFFHNHVLLVIIEYAQNTHFPKHLGGLSTTYKEVADPDPRFHSIRKANVKVYEHRKNLALKTLFSKKVLIIEFFIFKIQ